MTALESSPASTEVAVVVAQRYQFSPQLRECDTQGLSDHLQKSYDQVEVVDLDLVRLGFWERKPTFGRIASGEVVRIKEIVRPYYLRPAGELLDMFSTSPGSETNYFFTAGQRSDIVQGMIEWRSEDLAYSDYPLFSVMWDESSKPEEGSNLRRSVVELGGSRWSQIPETDRQRMENGLVSWSIKCDYRERFKRFILKGVTFSNQGGVLLYVEPQDQIGIELAHFVGSVMDILYSEEQGPNSFFLKP